VADEQKPTQINPQSPVTLGLSMTAGLGLTLMIVALGIGVVQGDSANSTAIGLAFLAGLALLVMGFFGWFGVVQPHKHFDDINVPMEADHHGHDEAHTEKH
jgi:hypothetical protein